MGCNCKKKPEIVLPVVTPTIVEEKDWYNNIDTIEPISGQTRN